MVGWYLRETRAEIRHTRGARRLALAAVLFLLSPVLLLLILVLFVALVSAPVEMLRSAWGTFLVPAQTAGPAIGAFLALAAAMAAMPRARDEVVTEGDLHALASPHPRRFAPATSPAERER